MNAKPVATFRHSLWHFPNWFRPVTDRLEIYADHIVWRSGPMATNYKTIPMSQITDVFVSTGCLGALLGYGLVEIQTAGSPKPEVRISALASPIKAQQIILAQLEAYRRK